MEERSWSDYFRNLGLVRSGMILSGSVGFFTSSIYERWDDFGFTWGDVALGAGLVLATLVTVLVLLIEVGQKLSGSMNAAILLASVVTSLNLYELESLEDTVVLFSLMTAGFVISQKILARYL